MMSAWAEIVVAGKDKPAVDTNPVGYDLELERKRLDFEMRKHEDEKQRWEEEKRLKERELQIKIDCERDSTSLCMLMR